MGYSYLILPIIESWDSQEISYEGNNFDTPTNSGVSRMTGVGTHEAVD